MQHRLDTGKIADFRETPEGFLDVFFSFSKTGPLLYQRADGSVETEYLTEEELFNEDSLATATGKPVTYLHPPEWVTSDNARKYARGSTGTKIVKDMPFATIVATVHDAELINVIKSGLAKQVSMGYTTEVVKKDDGLLYQTKRQYNHAAVVPLGRAGADVKVHFDGIDVLQECSFNQELQQNRGQPYERNVLAMTFTELKIDDKTTIKIGASEGEQAIAMYLRQALDSRTSLLSQLEAAQSLVQKADKSTTDLQLALAECDQQKARADVAHAKLIELENRKVDADEIKASFDQGYQRHVLEVTAAKFLPPEIKIDAAMSSKDIKLAVIRSQLKLKTDSDDAKRYDAQSETYIDAAYDLIIDTDSSSGLRTAINNPEREDIRMNSRQSGGEKMHSIAKKRSNNKLSLTKH